MSFILSLAAEQLFLGFIFVNKFRLHLYTNDKTPSYTDVIADYTEMIAPGYASISLATINWNITLDSLTNRYLANYPKQTFAFTNTVTAYGYYLTDDSSSMLVLAERFPDAPVVIDIGGGNISVTPVFGLK